MTVRCIAKVADAYKLDRKTRRRFRRYAAQPYDDRIFRLCSDTALSLWTAQGRMTIPYQCGARQRALLAYRKGEVDLMYIKGTFYLAVVCDVLEPETIGIERVLGVDLGIVNLAVDSDGTVYTGETIEQKRQRYQATTRRVATPSAPGLHGGDCDSSLANKPDFSRTPITPLPSVSWRRRNAPAAGIGLEDLCRASVTAG